MKIVTALDLRKKLGSVLNDVSKKGKPVIISRANKPLAVMISIEEYENKVLKKDRQLKLKDIAFKMDTWGKKYRKEVSNIDVVKAIREMRESR